jgi:hypothetical protein
LSHLSYLQLIAKVEDCWLMAPIEQLQVMPIELGFQLLLLHQVNVDYDALR